MNKILDAVSSDAVCVLLVEDSSTDVEMTKRAFVKEKLSVDLYHVPDGQECMKFLRREDGYDSAPVPDLILLDLNMPLMNGHEVLEEIVADDELRKLPVVVLTTSDAETDILSSYKLRCSSYITKPVDFMEFRKIVQAMGEYWFTVVRLPSANK